MKPRPYQLKAVESIDLHETNLIVMPQRSGKSFVMELAIDHFKFKKVLILVGYRKIVKQLANYFEGRFTHILSGETFDKSKQVHIASFQTLSNRNIDLSKYGLIIIDEFHSRLSSSVYDLIANTGNATHLLFTGTPLTNRNKLITKGIDNFIQPITVQKLLEQKFIAPTQFMSNSDIIGKYATQLKTNKQDFDQSIVRQIIKTEDLLANIRKLIIDEQLDTKHNTVIYVNYIETAESLYELLSDLHNVNIVHSKLTQSQQSQALDNYESDFGVLINVRALSLGWDSPRTDRLIYGFFTKIHSLALQILWRASTLNPDNPTKLTKVYDLTGQLSQVNPYTNFSSYSKRKSSAEECLVTYRNDPFLLNACLESCKSEPVLVKCDGKPSLTVSNNPFASNYQIIEGKPCNQSYPSWEFKFKSVDAGIGLITKYAKCPCGCVTSYDLQTLHQPSNLIPVYNDSNSINTVTILFSKDHMKALALFDDITKKSFKIIQFNSSELLYIKACKYFNNKPFQILSNAKLSKLPNVTVDKSLSVVLPLINWDSNNSGLVRKLIKAKYEHIANFFNCNPKMSYYAMKGVTKDNEKDILYKLTKNNFTKSQFLKLHKTLSN